MTIEEQIAAVEKKASDIAIAAMETKGKEIFAEERKALDIEIKAIKDAQETGAKSSEETLQLKAKLEKAIGDLEALEVKVKKAGDPMHNSKGENNFGGLFKAALKENTEQLQKAKKGQVREVTLNLKAAGDENMEFSNFASDTYADLTTERRGLFQAPYAPLWLRQLFPISTTTSDSIRYLKENGGTGAAAIWDGSGPIEDRPSKPGVAFNFTKATENIDWIAGITRIPREMLDDIPWLYGYITQQLTVGKRGLFVAENAFISGKLDANSTAYDGTKTIPVEKLYDAGFGQLRDNYYNPSTFLMNHRDVVNQIALNKASGSGEYDLPNGTVAIVGGQLYLSGVPVVGVPNVPRGTAYVFDRNATQFISRMSPEIRLFEQDQDNVEKNLLTVRAEERVGMLILDDAAIIKVDLTETT